MVFSGRGFTPLIFDIEERGLTDVTPLNIDFRPSLSTAAGKGELRRSHMLWDINIRSLRCLSKLKIKNKNNIFDRNHPSFLNAEYDHEREVRQQ